MKPSELIASVIALLEAYLRFVLSWMLLAIVAMVLLRMLGVPWAWLRIPFADDGQKLGILLAALAWVIRGGGR